MAAASGSRSRALVLGGGGPVGVGWEIGLAAGLLEGGVAVAEADMIVGTSAGSITGAMLASGDDVADLFVNTARLMKEATEGSGTDQVPTSALGQLVQIMMRSASSDKTPEEIRTEIGTLALEAETISEDAWVGSMARQFGGKPWPSRFSCTAVDVADGSFMIWNEASNVPLERAVASSCTVPGIYPPVTIDGHRYMDGGMRSALNADLAAGHDAAIVVSCMIMDLPPGLDDPNILAFFQREKDSIAALEAAGAAVEVIVPDEEFLNISGFGMNLMDFSQVQPATEAGHRLGKKEADRIRSHW